MDARRARRARRERQEPAQAGAGSGCRGRALPRRRSELRRPSRRAADRHRHDDRRAKPCRLSHAPPRPTQESRISALVTRAHRHRRPRRRWPSPGAPRPRRRPRGDIGRIRPTRSWSTGDFGAQPAGRVPDAARARRDAVHRGHRGRRRAARRRDSRRSSASPSTTAAPARSCRRRPASATRTPIPHRARRQHAAGPAQGRCSCGSVGSRVAVVDPARRRLRRRGQRVDRRRRPTTASWSSYDVQRSVPRRAPTAPCASAATASPPSCSHPTAAPASRCRRPIRRRAPRSRCSRRAPARSSKSRRPRVVHYTGVLWDDNSVFDSTWEKGAPGRVRRERRRATAQVIPGFSEGDHRPEGRLADRRHRAAVRGLRRPGADGRSPRARRCSS